MGACLETQPRTIENDNDKSKKYFQEPSELVRKKDLQARTAEDSEGNALIQKLKKQSEENREKNDLLIQQKTFMNDQVSKLVPFSR